ncbi:cell wall protein [Striga asiatica]|uniref:Cell wall protein n=1 Tax=Striga asiatica TaxID=4170 RepID=A0A5A7QIC2_STRAF|nr:cell wall protein [Striga asiatica]
MASTPPIFLGLTIFLLTSLTVHIANGREFPTESAHLHPEWAGHFDRSVLIPGIGRVIFPKKGSHANPFTYNPVIGGFEWNKYEWLKMMGSLHFRSYHVLVFGVLCLDLFGLVVNGILFVCISMGRVAIRQVKLEILLRAN